MAKFKPKDFFLQKGEKIVLGVALALMGLFAVLGIGRLAAKDNPAERATKFKEVKRGLEAAVQRTDNPDVKPLEAWVTSTADWKQIDPKPFQSNVIAFETVDSPSTKKDNPLVLGITQYQADLVRAPIKAFEVQVTEAGTKIGLLYNMKLNNLNTTAMRDGMKNSVGSRFKKGGAAAPPPAPPPTPPPGAQPPTPPPAVMSGGGGGRGREEGRGRGGMPGASMPDAERTGDKTLQYKPIEDLDTELAKEGVIPALSVYPLRMVVVQATFPLKEQLEVIRRALRLKTLEEAAAATAPPGGGQGPTFAGFEVERKITAPNGQAYDWAPYDHVEQYKQKIYIRKFADAPDDGLLAYFLRYDQMMAMPLPELAANIGVYPEVRLPAIKSTYKKMQDAAKPKITPSDRQKQFSGTSAGNPFAPSQTGSLGGVGTQGGFTGSGPVIGVAPENRARPLPGTGPAVPPPGTTPGYQPITTNMPELEHLMIRFMDVDIMPGFTYQYRIRVKMKNPNYGKKTEVARPDDATKEILYGPFVPIPTEINVPFDHNVYVGDPVAYSERVQKEYRDVKVRKLLDNDSGRQPVVQFQSWIDRVPIEAGKSEPAGYWVVAEVPVNRGEYIGRKQIVTLPMWSSEKERFILQSLAKYTVKGTNEQPKGMLVDFTTPMICVDYEGGKVTTKVGDRAVEDEADTEIMILKPDGTVEVKKSSDERKKVEDPKDMTDRDRREKEWYEWLAKIKKDTEEAGPTTGTGGNSGNFGTTPTPRP